MSSNPSAVPEVLVLGAAGFLGLASVEALLGVDCTPRCGHRRRTNVLVLRRRPVPRVLADLDDPGSLEAAMAGCDVVVHAAGHYPRLSLDRRGTLELGRRQTEAVLDAAARTGVRRLVYLSTMATVAPRAGGPSTEADRYPRAPRHGVYHDLKWEMEERVLAESRFETVVACPGACLGPWDLRLGTCALLVALAHGMDPPHPDGWVNLVDVRDVGQAVARLVLADRPPRRVLLSGSDHRLHGLLEMLAPWYGVAPPSPPLSAAEAIDLANAEEWACAGGGRPKLHREIVDLVLHGGPVDTRLAEEALGLRWRPLVETLEAFDTWARRLGFLPKKPLEHAP